MPLVVGSLLRPRAAIINHHTAIMQMNRIIVDIGKAVQAMAGVFCGLALETFREWMLYTRINHRIKFKHTFAD